MNDKEENFSEVFVVILGILVAFTVVVMIIANMVGGTEGPQWSKEIVQQRIEPIGQVYTGAMPPPDTMAVASTAAKPSDPGQAAYESACFACHGTGAAGAPKTGDRGAWAARIAQGMDTLTDHAFNGFKTMPAKGGHANLDEAAIRGAVEYMVNNSK